MMERRTQFNLAYLLFALFAMLALQQWWQQAQTVEVVPYSEFEKLLAEDRISEVVISDQRITGKLKSPENGKILETWARRLLEKETLAGAELGELRTSLGGAPA